MRTSPTLTEAERKELLAAVSDSRKLQICAGAAREYAQRVSISSGDANRALARAADPIGCPDLSRYPDANAVGRCAIAALAKDLGEAPAQPNAGCLGMILGMVLIVVVPATAWHSIF